MITTDSSSSEAREKRITELEQSVSTMIDELAQLKRERGEQKVVQDYALSNWQGGTTKLSDLFGDKQDLMVIHNMGQGCSYCTLWADGFNGFTQHFNDRCAFVLVSPDAPEIQQQFAESRGWTFRMLSGSGNSFISDMGFVVRDNDKDYYQPGYSTFRKQDDGSIVRIGYDYFGPGDLYCSPWHMFALLDNGVGEWHPKKRYE